VTFDDVRKISLAWPEVEDGTSYGTPAKRAIVEPLLRRQWRALASKTAVRAIETES